MATYRVVISSKLQKTDWILRQLPAARPVRDVFEYFRKLSAQWLDPVSELLACSWLVFHLVNPFLFFTPQGARVLLIYPSRAKVNCPTVNNGHLGRYRSQRIEPFLCLSTLSHFNLASRLSEFQVTFQKGWKCGHLLSNFFFEARF